MLLKKYIIFLNLIYINILWQKLILKKIGRNKKQKPIYIK